MSVLSKYLSVIVWALAMLVLAVPASAQAQRDIAQDSAPFVYEVERLENGGGGGAGAPLDLDTPLGLVESFMAAGEAGEFEPGLPVGPLCEAAAVETAWIGAAGPVADAPEIERRADDPTRVEATVGAPDSVARRN